MLAQSIAEQAVEASSRPLPDSVAHAARRALIDWVAAALAGADHPGSVALWRASESIAGPGRSSLVLADQPVDARTAALINGTASHAREVDDIYRDGLFHPGSPTVAAALAITEAERGDGATLLSAIAIGYEVSCRIAAAINPAHYRFWHTTGTVGTMGAAIGASVALGIPAEQLAHALSVATTQAAGLQQSFRSESMAKPLHAGHAAASGLLAALGAKNGFTGALDVLEGPAGFGAAMSGEVDWSSVTAPWHEPWAVAEVTVKNHTACGHTFAPIDATLSLRREYEIKPDDVASIVVETARIPIEVAGNLAPATEFEAKFSIPYCVASALLVGSVRLDAFSPTALSDRVARDLIARTELQAVEEFDEVFPTQRAARVVITLKDGQRLAREAWTRRGDPDDPLSDDEISEKFVELATPSLGASAAQVLDRLWKLDADSSVERIFATS
jgi:2-methylcitrate dehydratase PrpD